MANIYVGFHDQRSCNRILKPPGGGTSDIFGTDAPKIKKEEKSDPKTLCQTKEDSVKTASQSTPERRSDSNNTKQEDQSDSPPKIEHLSINEENGEQTEVKSGETRAEAKPDTIGSIIRQQDKIQSPVTEPEKKTPQRVPPGGYSSGLW